MMREVGAIAWDDPTEAIPAFLTLTVMPFTYSITNGIGAGFVSFVVLKMLRGRGREVHPLMFGGGRRVRRLLRHRRLTPRSPARRAARARETARERGVPRGALPRPVGARSGVPRHRDHPLQRAACALGHVRRDLDSCFPRLSASRTIRGRSSSCTDSASGSRCSRPPR